jgi:hypothetical protein
VNQFPVAIATREAQWDFNSWPYLAKTWEAKGHLQFSVHASIFSLSVAETSLFKWGIIGKTWAKSWGNIFV